MRRRRFQLGRCAADPVAVGNVTRLPAVANDNDLLQKRLRSTDFLNHWQQGLIDDEHTCPTVTQHVRVIAGLEQRVHTDGNRADFHGAEEGGHPLGTIGREDRHALPHADAESFERVPDLVRLCGNFLKAHLPVKAIQGNFIGTLGQVALQNVHGVIIQREVGGFHTFHPYLYFLSRLAG